MIEAKDHYDAALGIALTLLTATWPAGRLGLSSREHMAVAPASTGKNNATAVAATVAFSPLVAVSAATTPNLPDPAARRLPESRQLGLPPLPLPPTGASVPPVPSRGFAADRPGPLHAHDRNRGADHRLDLLHRDILRFGTITNTLAAACEFSGTIHAEPPPQPGRSADEQNPGVP